VFKWPASGTLVVPGILNLHRTSYLLADANKAPLRVTRREEALSINVPRTAPDSGNSVVVLEVAGKPDVTNPPAISADFDIFVDAVEVSLSSDRENVEIRYTLDGSIPTKSSALARGRIRLVETTEVSARCFRGGKPVSGTSKMKFTKVKPRPAMTTAVVDSGLHYSYFEGDWDKMPDFGKLHAVKTGTIANFDLAPRKESEHYGFEYAGLIRIPRDGVYAFFTESDDGSQLSIDGSLLVNNDGLHGVLERKGVVALASGYHSIKVDFFQKGGGAGLNVSILGPQITRQAIPDTLLFHK
jgi:hypothetical protein